MIFKSGHPNPESGYLGLEFFPVFLIFSKQDVQILKFYKTVRDYKLSMACLSQTLVTWTVTQLTGKALDQFHVREVFQC